MTRFLPLLSVLFFVSCSTTTYYISRHAERAGVMSNDPPLTAEGEKQAQDLRDYLKGKKIGAAYATGFVRTKATAKPTADFYSLPVNVYNAAQPNGLVDSLKAGNKRNVLIVGHSNTVDDIVNRFTGTAVLTDLPDTAYGNIFIVRKKGSGYSFEKIRVPRTTPR